MDEESIKVNLNATINFFSSLPSTPNLIGNDFLWSNIDNKSIQKFVYDFKHYKNDSDPLGLRSKFPIKAIKKYIETNEKWDVVLFSGQGELCSDVFSQEFKRSKRKVTIKSTNEIEHYEIGNRQLSSERGEGVPLKHIDKSYKFLNRKEDRRERERQKGNPLLMIYVLDAEVKEEGIVIPNLVAYGISFPGSSLSTGHEIELLINTVYYDDLLNDDHEE